MRVLTEFKPLIPASLAAASTLHPGLLPLGLGARPVTEEPYGIQTSVPAAARGEPPPPTAHTHRKWPAQCVVCPSPSTSPFELLASEMGRKDQGGPRGPGGCSGYQARKVRDYEVIQPSAYQVAEPEWSSPQ